MAETTAAATDWDNAKINRQIAAGEFEAAGPVIDARLEATPGFLPARMARIRLLLARDEVAEAARLAAALYDDVQGNAWVWVLAVQALARAGQAEALCETFIEGATWLTLDETTLLSALNAAMPAAGGTAAQLSLLREAVQVLPENRDIQLRLATRAYALGQVDMAIDMLTRAEASGPLPAYARRVQSQLYPRMGSWAQAADRLAADIAARDEPDGDVELLCRLCRYQAAAGRFDEAAATLDRALLAHPEAWRPIYRLTRVFLPAEQDAALFDRLEAYRQANPTDRNWQLQFAFFALRAGRDATAVALLTDLAGDEVVGPTARDLLAALEALPVAEARPGVLDHADVRVIRKEGARGTLLSFGNFLGGLSYIPDRRLDAALADLPLNVVYLRDPHGRAYLNGIPGLGPDAKASFDALGRLVAGLDGERIITLGSSAAGHAALRAGLAIGADRVISLAGLVTPDQAGQGEAQHNRNALDELFGPDLGALDLRPGLEARPDTRLSLVFGDAYGPDVARSAAVAGLGNVDLHPMAGVSTHHCAIAAISDGTLIGLLRQGLGQDG